MRVLLAMLLLAACGSGNGGPDAAPDPHELVPCAIEPGVLCERACADREYLSGNGAETCLAWWVHDGERKASPCRETNTFEVGAERGCCKGSGDASLGEQPTRYFAVCE